MSHLVAHRPEVLAPAGDLTCALAAFESGADAVYIGLSQFSARARATGISLDDLGRLMQYARANGKKVYVAMNTLLRDAELNQMLELASELVRYQVDAVIIQDLGALHIFQNYFPEMTLHASTQMGLHNSAGLAFAATQNFKRVILERQVTWNELQKMVPNAPVETEVFVHGALCISLSGQCLMSSWQNGCSGNRGQCKQPCRRRWKTDQGEGYFLSPDDLSIIDYVPKLARLGVKSLKIEGRLRKPDYVMAVSRAFRAAVDADGNSDALQNAKSLLSEAMGRNVSSGFLTAQSQSHLIRPEIPGVQGHYCGEVVQCSRHGMRVKLTADGVQCGDRLRIQSADGMQGAPLTLTEIRMNGRSVGVARKGSLVEIPFEGYVPRGAGVYCIGKSMKSYERLAASLLPWHEGVDLSLNVYAQKLVIRAQTGRYVFDWEFPWSLSSAQNKPLDVAQLESAFKVTGDPKKCRFALKKLTAKIDGDYFIPSSILKNVRQCFWTAFDDFIPSDARFTNDDVLVKIAQDLQCPERAPLEKQNTIIMRNSREIDHRYPGDFYVMPIHFAQAGEGAFLPAFIPEDALPKIRNEIAVAYERGVRVFRVNSFAAFELLKEYISRGVELHVALPLPIANIAAVLWARAQGASCFTAWHELEQSDKYALVKHAPLVGEICIYSRPVLMSVRAHVPVSGLIADPNESYEVLAPNALGITRVIPLRHYEETPSPYAHRLVDLTHPSHDHVPGVPFNASREWK